MTDAKLINQLDRAAEVEPDDDCEHDWQAIRTTPDETFFRCTNCKEIHEL